MRALAARYGHPADTLSSAAAAARTDPALRADLADRVVLGLAPVLAVLDPDLVVLAGPTATAGGEPLRHAVCAALRRAAPFEVTVKITCVDGDAVVLGGLDAALRAVRSRLVASVRAVSPAHGGKPAGLARP